MTSPTPARRPRRLWRWLAAGLVGLGLVGAALPWILGSGLARGTIARGINRAFAPGRLEFDSIELGWFGPTRLSNVRLLDPAGKTVGSAPLAVLDRNLGQLITFHAASPITLDLDGTALDVERKADGVVDLVAALRSIIAVREPKRHVTIRITRGTLRYQDPALLEPATADALDLNLQIPPAPAPITWDVKLADGDARLEVQGDFDHHLVRGGTPKAPGLRLAVLAKLWPVATRAGGLDSSGKLDGSIDVVRQRGHWRLSGDAKLLGLKVRGKALDGDTLALDRLEAGWDLAEGDEGWSIRRLGVTSALGQLKAEGQMAGSGLGKQRVEGKLDLAAIARQLPHALRLRDGLGVDKGTARLTVDVDAGADRTSYDVEAVVADLAATDHDRRLSLRDPATLTARLVRSAGGSSLERLAVKTSFLDASARGKLDEGVTLDGSVDLAGFRRQLGEWVDLGRFDLAGRLELSGTYRSASDRYESTIKANVRDLRVDGVGSTVVRRDSASIESVTSGPSDGSGSPKGWDRASIHVRSGESLAKVEARSVGRAVAWSAEGKSNVTLSGRSRSVEGRMAGNWSTDARDVTFDEVTVAIVPGPGELADSRLEATARGRVDLSTGELVLEPSGRAGSIAVGQDGVRVSGLGQGLAKLRVDGAIAGDLAGLDKSISSWTGRAPMDLTGRWSATASARGDGDGLQVAAKLGLDEPSVTGDRPNRPTSLTLRAHYSPASDRLDLAELTMATGFGTVDASGHVDDPGGARRLDLKGTVAPDFEAINRLLARKVEPGARIEGKSRPFRATGTIGDGLDAEVGFDLVGLDIYGMKVGPAPVVLHSKGGKLVFDPISTTLNEGHIRLEPEIDLNASGGPMLRLAKNSTIRDARINDEVSRRVLAYVAPILDRATRASGLVTVDLDHAEFPIGAGRGRQAKVEGAVVFNDVEFAPGPLANDLLAAAGRRDVKLKLDQPLTLTIADGRINQRGLAIPIGELTRIEISGWVDFDKNMALTAALPVTPAMLGNNELLADIAAGTMIRVPITGTLNQPKIDRDAMSASLKELGTSLLTRGATRGAMELLKRLGRPRDPNAPPPPTPEERKERRMERKADRLEKRDKPPGND